MGEHEFPEWAVSNGLFHPCFVARLVGVLRCFNSIYGYPLSNYVALIKPFSIKKNQNASLIFTKSEKCSNASHSRIKFFILYVKCILSAINI